MSPSLGVPSGLPHLVHDAFVRAKTAGDLSFFPTQVALLRVHGVPFQLRFAPALAKKPKAAKPAGDKDKSAQPPTPFNPFEDPPPGLMVIPDVCGGTHRLVLNKFAISQDHSILATTTFRPQAHVLEATDLAAAYTCIEAYADAGEELFVFFNSGSHSGASQPHRHLQLLPVAKMREGLEDGGSGWDVLVDRLIEGKSGEVPFYVAAARLSPGSTPSSLHTTYLDLYRQARAAAQGTSAVIATGDVDTTAEESGDVPASISYNLALTKETMAIIPRTAEGASVTSDGGSLSLNGTVLAGTALVKNEAEWDALKSDSSRLEEVLAQIGVPLTRRTAAL
ncbi:bifunctional AP-4-A phosphorylase/ADP sulfurylase [Sporothrix eucalyptigena]|uniref:Bifunctional AP-4-A phosphorylase/ADP sulfurylase n=1 Tax=Sporothrix eucalyptigena TaxID=1812306 RepID=A0ABP0D188_9PEZI